MPPHVNFSPSGVGETLDGFLAEIQHEEVVANAASYATIMRRSGFSPLKRLLDYNDQELNEMHEHLQKEGIPRGHSMAIRKQIQLRRPPPPAFDDLSVGPTPQVKRSDPEQPERPIGVWSGSEGSGGTRGGSSNRPITANGPLAVRTVLVAESDVGRLIGKKGSKIEQLRADSGAQLELLSRARKACHACIRSARRPSLFPTQVRNSSYSPRKPR